MNSPLPEWTTFPVPLNEAVWPSMLAALVATLERSGVERLQVMHGWTQSALEDHPDFLSLQWQSQAIALSELLALIAERQRLGMRLGRDDLYVEGEDPEPWQVLLCHEGDMHIRTRDDRLIADLQACVASFGVTLIRKAERSL